MKKIAIIQTQEVGKIQVKLIMVSFCFKKNLLVPEMAYVKHQVAALPLQTPVISN